MGEDVPQELVSLVSRLRALEGCRGTADGAQAFSHAVDAVHNYHATPKQAEAQVADLEKRYPDRDLNNPLGKTVTALSRL